MRHKFCILVLWIILFLLSSLPVRRTQAGQLRAEPPGFRLGGSWKYDLLPPTPLRGSCLRHGGSAGGMTEPPDGVGIVDCPLRDPVTPFSLCGMRGRDNFLLSNSRTIGNSGEPEDKSPFSIKLWTGVFDPSNSMASSNDSITYLEGKEKDFIDNFWAAGIKFTDIPVFPSARKGVGKWISAGIDIFILNGDYTIRAISSDGLSSQRSELNSKTIVLAGHVKISPFVESSFQPYIGIGVGPAYTNLRDTRTTVLNGGTPALERDRVWDTSNFGNAFGGINIYLGKSFYLNMESQWLGIGNKHFLFANPDTNHHTAEVKTVLQGWLSSFGLGIKF